MHDIILDKLVFEPEIDKMISKMHLNEKWSETDTFREMVIVAQKLAKPKAFYKISGIQSRNQNSVAIDGQVFESRVLRVNTDEINRVFPFVATCGAELTEWAATFSDMMEKFFADEIKMTALRSALSQLSLDVEKRFYTGKLSQMNPGSLEDWPIYEQKKLFAVLGKGAATIGVALRSSMVMYPDKSESGIFFEKEKFSNCQLCPRNKCPSRSAPYDEGLYEREYFGTQ